MKFDDKKVYEENRKDVSDEALAKSDAHALILHENQNTNHKEKLRHYAFLQANASPMRFKHKQILLELYRANSSSWGRAKRIFILQHLSKPFKTKMGPNLDIYLKSLITDIEYEQIRLNNKEMITTKAIEQLEQAAIELDSVNPNESENPPEAQIKLAYSRVNLAKGYKAMLPADPLVKLSVNQVNNSQTTNNNLHIGAGVNGKIESTEKELEKIATKYGITVGQAKAIGRERVEIRKKSLEGEVIDADTLE